jgi:signal transduction histidine kinase/ActR/RegA family two-component response regulator
LDGKESAEAWSGKSILQLISPEEHEKAKAVLERTLTERLVRGIEFNFYRRDGIRSTGELNIGRLDNFAGEPIGFVAVIRDITEWVQAEEERELLLVQIRGQAQQMENVMRAVPEAVLLLDAKGQVILANTVAENDLAVLTDAKAGDIITHLGGRPLAELLTSPPTKGLWHELTAGSRTFEVIARPIENDSEQEDWVMVINDVTQEREIQHRIQHQERLAAVGQMAAGIAHDFNNIMAIITLYTEMELKNPVLPPQLHERLQTILQQAHRASDLIQQILDFSRQAVLERIPIDLRIFMKEIVKLLKRTIPENITISLSYGTDRYLVNADPTRIQQAVMNLVVNARDAMSESGELRIVLSKVAETDDIRCVTCGSVIGGEWISISVTDTGSGIPPDVLPYIFEPFFTTKEPGQGTGLGLAQVHGIVTQHEGHIDVTSKMGEGTTFTIYLPVMMVQEVTKLSVGFEDTPRGRGETVLVVEDNAKIQEALAAILEMLNYKVMLAPNGREALDILAKHGHEVALVLSDLVMPVMGGKALFYALNKQYPEIKMVMLTGHLMEKELQDMLAEGLNSYLLKPPNMDRLAQEISRVMKGDSE